jgi:triosephosphate isomerase
MQEERKSEQAAPGRTPFVGGNWKSNGTPSDVETWMGHLNDMEDFPNSVQVLVSPPTLFLERVLQSIRSDVIVSAQNISLHTGFGAYTGEISGEMLQGAGISWTLVGHSERRAGFGLEGESSSLVAAKTVGALTSSVNVVLCVGESLEERNNGKTLEVVFGQLREVVAAIDALEENAVEDPWSHIVVAYEPVWAIGTGVTATAEQAQEVHRAIRQFFSEEVDSSVASSIRIIYGGSVKASNAEELISCEDIDGFLVGGASLKPEFADIIRTVAQSHA